MMNDPLANALSTLMNAENRSEKRCTISPVSNVIRKVLDIMNSNNYLGKFTETGTAQGPAINAELIGAINKCGAIKPRYTVRNRNFEKYEKKFLPAKDFGFLIVSTSQGIMTHTEAKKKSLGGKLLAYFY